MFSWTLANAPSTGSPSPLFSFTIASISQYETPQLDPPKLAATIRGTRELTLGLFSSNFPFAGMETIFVQNSH
jgi:hypothetical protein